MGENAGERVQANRDVEAGSKASGDRRAECCGDEDARTSALSTSIIRRKTSMLSEAVGASATRLSVLQAIIASLEGKRPDWDQNRILHLSTQLEESMHACMEPQAACENASTLEILINRHCLLLARKKTACRAHVCGSGSARARGDLRHQRADEEHGSNAGSNWPPVPSPPTLTLRRRVSGRGAAEDGPVVWPHTNAPAKSQMRQRPITDTSHAIIPQRKDLGEGPRAQPGSYDTRSGDRALRDTQGVNSVQPQAAPGAASAEVHKAAGAKTISPGNVAVAGFQDEHAHESKMAGATALTGQGSGMAECHEATGANRREAKEHALRLVQCRVLLLAHGSTCSEEQGACKLSPVCDAVRHLLRHMCTCRDSRTCGFTHCDSSKAVLRHRSMCHDAACKLCASVRELCQKCFWANARHAHKRRLQESYELRRKKRQIEGKVVPPVRKEVEKPKTAKEICWGLDEAGNDLGDISLGFFLRQEKAMKAVKAPERQENGTSHHAATSEPEAITSASAVRGERSGVGGGMDHTRRASHAPKQHRCRDDEPGETQARAQELRDSTTTAANRPAAATHVVAVDASSAASFGHTVAPSPSAELASQGNLGRHGDGQAEGLGPVLTAPRYAHTTPSPTGRVQRGTRTKEGRVGEGYDAEGRAEARRIVAPSGGGRGQGSRGGGMSVVVPCSGSLVGHLRRPSERTLDEIAESLADATSKPSFARMQSVQAFLDEHVELRESASFGDVSALVEQWMNVDEGIGDMDQLGMSGAFSF